MGNSRNLSDIGNDVVSDGAGNITITGNMDATTITEGGSPLANIYSVGAHNHTLDSLSNTTITANTSGEVLVAAGSPISWINNTLAEAGISADTHTHINRIGHTWAIAGEIKVPSGDTDFIIPMFISLASGQTASIVECRYSINSGTSATVKLQDGGVDITGFTALSVTTTPTSTDGADHAVAEDDEIALVVTAVAGTPTHMNFTLFIEYTQ